MKYEDETIINDLPFITIKSNNGIEVKVISDIAPLFINDIEYGMYDDEILRAIDEGQADRLKELKMNDIKAAVLEVCNKGTVDSVLQLVETVMLSSDITERYNITSDDVKTAVKNIQRLKRLVT